jgi:hypothetical protein
MVYIKTKKVDNVYVPNLECPFTCEDLPGLLLVPCKGYFRTHMNADQSLIVSLVQQCHPAFSQVSYSLQLSFWM